MPGVKNLGVRDNQNPCKECHEKNESYLGCHGECDKYKTWSEEHNAKRLQSYQDKKRRSAVDVYKRDEIARYKKAKGR